MTSHLPDVQILSRDLMQGVLRRARVADLHHVVSISDPEDGPPREVRDHPGRTLVLCFHDVSRPDEYLTMPTEKDVRAIVKFSAAIEPRENVLCHCNAGISRSSAAALTVLASKLEPSRRAAREAVDHLLRAKRMIHPNRAMVAFADDLLGYGGELVDAHADAFNTSHGIIF